MSEHTSEPWFMYREKNGKPSGLVLAEIPNVIGNGPLVADCERELLSEGLANAARIVSCVNACAGIKRPELIPEIIEELETLSLQHQCSCGHPFCNRCEDFRSAQGLIARAKGKEAV